MKENADVTYFVDDETISSISSPSAIRRISMSMRRENLPLYLTSMK